VCEKHEKENIGSNKLLNIATTIISTNCDGDGRKVKCKKKGIGVKNSFG